MQLRAAAPAREQGRFASVVGVKTDAGSEQARYELSSDVLTAQCFRHSYVCYMGFGRLHLKVCNQALDLLSQQPVLLNSTELMPKLGLARLYTLSQCKLQPFTAASTAAAAAVAAAAKLVLWCNRGHSSSI
jgi:hypothetical protein